MTAEITADSVRLTVSLTDEIPAGYKKTMAIVKDDSVPRKKGASRQKKLEEKKREEGLRKAYVPLEILDLADRHGWSEILFRAKRERSFMAKLFTNACSAFLGQLKSTANPR